MFDIAPTELMLVAFVALVVIGPKDLPKAMRVVGYWVGRARGVARQFRSGFDQMVREAELEEMEKKWAAENERIMREHPPVDPVPSDPPAPHDPAVPHDPAAPHDPAMPPAPAAPATTPDAVPHDTTDRPVMVEKPQVAPADNARPGTSEGAAS